MFKFLQSKKPNAVAVTQLLLKELKVKVNDPSIANELQDHPEFPSLMSISQCLSKWHVPNQSYDIPRESYDSTDLYFPFIAHIKANGGLFILIHSIIDQQVTYSDSHNKKAIISEKDFLDVWTGKALHATAHTQSGEENYRTKKAATILKEFKVPTMVCLILLAILFSLNFQALNLSYIILLGLKIMGTTVSLLLLMHSIDGNNPLVQNLCSLGSKNNCNAILKSDAAKLSNWLSWSEVGFFYFTGSFLTLLLVPKALPLIAWLNLLALPYTIYSFSYQYRNKNWCMLCCAVQFLLIFETITLFNSGLSINILNAHLNIKTIAAIGITFLIPIFIWSFLKSFFADAIQVKSLKQQLKKFKYNSDLFNRVLTNQPRYAIPDDLMPIILGNPSAINTITMVSNPFCAPCAKAHQTIDEWLKTSDDIKVKIIFTTANHDDDERTLVSRHVSALSLLKDVKLLQKALNDWYATSNNKYEEWAKKYPVSFDNELNAVTEKQKTWCDLTEITSTPTILLNGYKLPEPYRLADIKYLLS